MTGSIPRPTTGEPGAQGEVDVGVGRWQVEQVLALAPRPSSVAAAQPLAVLARWAGTGCDDRAVWGRCTGGSAEPYECVVDHVGVAFRCSCPSRVLPCKHSLALLLLWAKGQVAHGEPPAFAASWVAKRLAAQTVPAQTVPAQTVPAQPAPSAAAPQPDGNQAASATAAPPPVPEREPSSIRDERVARMAAGLAELDRWLDDRLRTGLADPALARYATWDDLAARLIDAQVGGLANRVRRLAGVVGAHPEWHQQVLAELGVTHLLATAGRQLGTLPPALADSVAAAIGWQVRQADVLAGVPLTDDWVVMGRSDTREDRIEVRRVWLRGRATQQWAMVLSFAAYGQSLDASLVVGTAVQADVFRYPGALGLRVLVGRRAPEPVPTGAITGGSVAQACAEVGRAVAAEPWIERFPLCLSVAPARAGGRWLLTDAGGSLPLVEGAAGVGALLACSEGRPLVVMAEWTPLGLVPLTALLPDRAVDIGPTADPSFLAAGA
ncbi:MAG: SWIM zinc finger family protein [Actinomycetota bacterium]|nr:SWIM zinc finger family protein [Actinomycetota bacterium]